MKPQAAWRLLSPVLVRHDVVFDLGRDLVAEREDSSPFGPFTLNFVPSTPAVIPFGTGDGLFSDFRHTAPSEHRAENFAAHVLLASIVVGHHALGRRQDRDAETVVHARQLLDGRIDAPAGL